jgi:hypothetical protein
MTTGSAANLGSQKLDNTEPNLVTAARFSVLHHATPAQVLPAFSSAIAGLAAIQSSRQAHQQQADQLHCGSVLITEAQPIMAFLPILDILRPIINTCHMLVAVVVTA